MNLAHNIKQARIRSGISQKDMAQKVGLSASALSLIESGNREPTVAFLQQFSKETKTSIGALFGEEPSTYNWRIQALCDTVEDHARYIDNIHQMLARLSKEQS